MAFNKASWIRVARLLIASRLIDTIEETELAPKGNVLYQFSSKGHELAQIILGECLNHPHDAATVYYRSRPFVMASGMTLVESFAGPLANGYSRNGGRDIGVVHNLTRRQGALVLPASGDVGAQYTPAVGWAQAIVYRSQTMQEAEWTGAVAVALAGDASCATNGFWSALTIATTQNYPMVFFIEDNGFGISVGGEFQTPGSNIAANLANFSGLKVIDTDGTNPETALAAIQEALSSARTRTAPVLLRLSVPRICGHSGADNQSYKTQEQKEEELRRDPFVTLPAFLRKKKYLTAKEWDALVADVEIEVRAALRQALDAPEPDVAATTRFAYSEPDAVQTVGGMRAEAATVTDTQEDGPVGQRMNFIDAVRLTLEHELRINPRVLVYGEDVGVKGGVHGATIDLMKKFGPERVFDTSLSEEGIIGRSVGLAYAGLVPVPEIQFRKYLDPAMEQINDTGTIRWRTNNLFAAPYVLRIPVGHSKRTGDPWHSVSGEAIFAHTIGWRIAFPSNAADAVGLLREALRGDDPTFFLEHRNLLDTSPGRSGYPGHSHRVPFGRAAVAVEGTKLTVVTWGEMVARAKDAAKLVEGVEVIDLRTISPWDKETVYASVKKTGRAIVLHEDCITAGFGAEVVAFIAQELFASLDAPVERMAPPDIPIPYNLKMMDVVIPTANQIAERFSKLIAY